MTENKTDDLVSCWIYKSSRKEEMYLYLAREEGFELVPEELRQSFGEMLFVMRLELAQESKLARADILTVIKALKTDGFYLQMPPTITPHPIWAINEGSGAD